MKCIAVLLFAVMGLSVPASAYAPSPAGPTKLFELMKCRSQKFGTVWVSFGHMLKSGQDEATYFPTEIGLFATDYTSHWVANSIDEALKVDLLVHPGFLHLQFDAMNGDKKETQLLRVLQYDKNYPNAYLGDWSVSENGQESVSDQASCSLD